MYFFTPDTIVQANKNIEALDSKFGGLLCVLHCLTENIKENVSYTIDGEKLRKQLSFVFDKDPKTSFENAKSSYIIFAKDWASTFFDSYIKNRVDLLSCAVFFLRRQGFEKEYTKEEVIDIFIKRFNLANFKEHWFLDSDNLTLSYNKNDVEKNQAEFYIKMEYNGFKSILFRSVIQKSAADLKAAGQIQTLYSGSGIQTCFLLSDEPLEQYYIMSNETQNNGSQGIGDKKDFSDIFDHNIYGIHIKMKNDALSDTNPHICIGWSKMGDLSDIKGRYELVKRYEATWSNEKNRRKGQDVGQIWRFIKEMQIGDYVVFANGDTCHIGRITSDYYFDNVQTDNQDPDYVNIRDVEWLKKDICKRDLSEVFQNSLGAAMSVFRLNDYKSAINDLLNGTYVKDETLSIEDEDIEIEVDHIGKDYSIEELAEILSNMYNNPQSTGKAMTPHMFGLKYGEIIEKNNYSVDAIATAAGLTEAYSKEIRKGVNIYKAIRNGEYGIRFYEPEGDIQATTFDYKTTVGAGINKIFYGVPGCGKSYHIQHKILGTTPYIRTTFYQDYSNTDFVGQILPKVVKGDNGEKDTVEYIFNPGPFTLALIKAISNPTDKIALVIEEINRGNAPAIFGDIFQLLDRDDDSISEYGIKNVGLIDYLNAHEFNVNGEKKRYHFDEIKIPGNLDIYATMNTSDQNVYTLDTAFTRRWSKEHIPNEFNGHKIEKMYVPGMASYTWGEFVKAVNGQIRDNLESLQVNEDKQVGAFFVKEKDLLENSADSTEQKAKMFAYKVLEYLWADVSKLDHQVIFNPRYTTFEDIVKDFAKGVVVFNDKLGFKTTVAPVTEAE